MCPTDLEKKLTAQQHLFPDFAQMNVHIVTVMNSRTRGSAPFKMGSVNDEASIHDARSDEFEESEYGELHRWEIINDKKVFTKPRHDSGEGLTDGVREEQSDRMFSLWTRWPHQSRRFTSMEDFRNGDCGEEEQEYSQHLPMGIIDLVSLKCRQTTARPQKTMLLYDES